MARNFSEDGALGAMTGGSPAPGQPGGALTPQIMTDFNMTGTPAGGGSTMPITPGSDATGGGGYGDGGFGSVPDSGGSPGAIPTGDVLGGHGGGYGGGGLAPMGYGGGASASGGSASARSSNGYGDSGGWAFSKGGAIDESMGGDPNATDPQGSMMGNKLQQQINEALGTVNNVLSYGRNLHGIGAGGQQQAMNDIDFRHSDNIEDRTGNDQSDQGRISNNVSNNWNNIKDKVSGMMAPDPTKNQMSQDAGINDIGGDGSTSTPGAQGAIDTEEEAQ